MVVIHWEVILSGRILIATGPKGNQQLTKKEDTMKQSTKKFITAFLTLALLSSFSIPVLAAETHDHCCDVGVVCEDDAIREGASPMGSCTSHTWQNTSTCVRYGGVYVSASVCKSYWKETRTCTKCGTTEFVRYYYVANDTHHTVVYSASCNGTTQTWLNECSQCGHSMPTTTRKCPGGPHSGSCGYLPV